MEKAGITIKSETVRKQVYGRIAELLYEQGLLTPEEKNNIKDRIEQEAGR